MDGQLSVDSVTCAWDADPQEAGMLDWTQRVSRLLAKTRRENGKPIVSGGETIGKTVTPAEVDAECQTGVLWSDGTALVLYHLGLHACIRRNALGSPPSCVKSTDAATREPPPSLLTG